MATFVERLDAGCTVKQSLVCVGLDPDPTLMPTQDVFAFNKGIVGATRDLVCAYKPNIAFYEALGLAGLKALEQTIQHIRTVAPEVVILMDAKRGDVGSTAIAYARAMFEVWGVDAATVSPYGGHDAVQPFLDYEDKGVFVWCRSSNPGAGELQDLVVSSSGEEGRRPFYEWVAMRAAKWNNAKNIGLVVGGTYPGELTRVRELCPDMPILIPGIGVQEGYLEESVRRGTDSQGRRALISSSRGIIYASRGQDFAEAARKATLHLRDTINATLISDGHGW